MVSKSKTGSPAKVELTQSIEAFRQWRKLAVADLCQLQPKDNAIIGFVPTMGYLHAGHMALVEKARRNCDLVVVSIFVNPLQFGPKEDFASYPRDIDRDVALLKDGGVDCVFNPSQEDIYGSLDRATTRVTPPSWLTDRLCGKFRPGHFEGVATVVTKLFNIVQPDLSFFGEKDYQQLLVVKKLVEDLNLCVQIEGVPIVREPDGLALSSRNVYLSAEARKIAPSIHEVLADVRSAVGSGGALGEALSSGREKLEKRGFEVQYLDACRAEDLQVLERAETPMVILCAAKLDGVRLIDNLIVR